MHGWIVQFSFACRVYIIWQRVSRKFVDKYSISCISFLFWIHINVVSITVVVVKYL